MKSIRRWLNTHHLNRRRVELAGLIVATLALQLAGTAGIAYVAGFAEVGAAFRSVEWEWLIVVLLALALSFTGYYYAYHGIYSVDRGEVLDRGRMNAVMTAGFGGFLAQGGTAIDIYAVQATGATKRNARVRVTALAGLEHGVLAIGACAASIAALILGMTEPPPDFTLPWAIVPVPGFALAFWLAERYRHSLQRRGGWRGKIGVFLDSIHLVRELFRRPFSHGSAPFSMGLFWAADMVAAWAAIAAFGSRIDAVTLIVGYCTGMVFTRRTAPMAGAGVMMLVMPVTLWYCGVEFATAVAGIFVYRLMSVWLPLPFALACLPTLREIGEPGVAGARDEPDRGNEPALRVESSPEE